MSQYRLLPGLLTGLSLLLLSAVVAQSDRTSQRHHGTERAHIVQDPAHVSALLEEADRLKELSKLDSAALLCRQALQLSLFLKDSFLIARSYYGLGQWALAANRKEEALAYLQRSLSVRWEKEQSSHTARVYNDMGYLYGNKGELDKQREWYLKAMRIYDRINDADGMAETLSNLSGSSLELGNKQEAIQYATQALRIRERGQDKDILALSYNNLSQIYLQMDSMDQAMRLQREGLRYAELSGSKRRLAQSYTGMSLMLNRRGKNEESFEYEKKAIRLCRETGDSGMLAHRCIAAAVLSGTLKDSVGAEGYFDEGVKISLAIDDKSNLRDLYYYRTVFYKERKDFYRAYESLKKYYAYKDSMLHAETARNIAEIQARYETEKKDKAIGELKANERIHQLEIEKQDNEISLLSQSGELQSTRIAQQEVELDKSELQAKSKEQELQLARAEKELKERQLQQQKQTRNILIGSVVLLALIAAGIFNRWQLKKKLQQQAALLEMRNLIARDLHDELGSTLTSIHILSQVSRNHLEKDQSGAYSLLEKITEQSRQMQQSMSDIVWAIRSDNDKIENMMVRMREYLAQTLEAREIAIRFEAAEELLGHSFSMQQRKEIFLIFKEAVNNAAKYSHCTLMEVSFRLCNARILLEVKDNGVGFEPDKPRSTNGLNNMRVRSASLDGRCHIQASPGRGTTVLLDLPAAT
ncbi:tetratricopeptide repeat protein [Flavitalea sp. BT771]|uniref:tetratricopeptide repeat-containing sensor histidine kinase n=1 Tax=Flavitalea sp. BT771 TaxID=3063329 RepID=UPI0026E48DDB|nr:tetratricopeptide repeat protein [Flavitalea sp. BT771]MDO6434870.1 tetratricopeptide repeat protein [Flavitalea sp. BT771]MDV6223770.1 tetratricopeptide repeat protein [Flavitalea sp. BT771]